MATQNDFSKFIRNIEPSNSTKKYISSVQNNLRNYLKNHDSYGKVYIDTFLSGSYAKNTAIRPSINDSKRDVDIIVVTNYSLNESPCDVLDELFDVLGEKKEYLKRKKQSHSIGIEMEGIGIDVVPVIINPIDKQLFYVGNSKLDDWVLTDPKGHKEWATDTNNKLDKKYKPLVKIFKWWRRVNCPNNIKYPKGIALEKLIADNMHNANDKIETLLIELFQSIVENLKFDIEVGIKPVVDDPSSKINGNDLFAQYEYDDIKAFVHKLEKHLEILNDSDLDNETWRKILGDVFPSGQKKSQLNALLCNAASHKRKPIWPMQRGGAAFISAKAVDELGNEIECSNNGPALPKNCSLVFRALTGVKKPYKIYWQIVNTGNEAREANCLRGTFELSNDGNNKHNEGTLYKGSHSIQCFIIKKGICVARSKEFIVNIL